MSAEGRPTTNQLHRPEPAAFARWRRIALQTEPTVGLGATTLAGIAGGLLFGGLEVVVKAIKYRVDHVYLEWSNPDLLWMIPTSLAALSLTVALILFALGPAPRRLSMKTLLFALIATGAFSCLISLKRLGVHRAAYLIIALGLAWQLAGLAARRPAWIRRGAAVAAAFGSVVVIVCFAWLSATQRTSAQSPLAQNPPASAPNVLVVVLDTVGARSLQTYGYPRQSTPFLAQLAAQGVVFDRAFSTAPWTLPSHASLFTGRWYTELSSDWLRPLDAEYPTLAEFLSAHGYQTGGFVANLQFTTRATGLDRGFGTYRDHERSLQTWLESSEITGVLTKWGRAIVPGGPLLFTRKYATTVNAELLEWLDRIGPQPFFAFVNYFDAHDPYERFAAVQNAPASTHPREFVVTGRGARRPLTREEKDTIDRYDSGLAFIDQAFRNLFDALEARGRLRNTLVIVTADHGEQFHEHGLTGHSNSLYGAVLHIPLFAVWPGQIPERRRVLETVSLRDIPATVVDLLGLSRDAPFPGPSLRRTWSGDAAAGKAVLAEANPYALMEFDGPIVRGPMQSIVEGNLHYIRNGDGVEELYDLDADAEEVDDLAKSERGQSLLPRLRQVLRELQPQRPALTSSSQTSPRARQSATIP